MEKTPKMKHGLSSAAGPRYDNRARARAYARLRRRYPNLYDRFFVEELRKVRREVPR